MITIKNYVRPATLEEAYALNQNRRNRVIGGMLWLKMSNASINTAIDLSDLGMDAIEETEDAFSIGAMVTLRQLELHPSLNAYTRGAVAASVQDIVGVQFRNMATIGGSIYSRFGFSDLPAQMSSGKACSPPWSRKTGCGRPSASSCSPPRTRLKPTPIPDRKSVV